MSAKAILEADGKAIVNYHLTRAPVIKPTPLPPNSTHNPPSKLASLYFAADADVKGVLDQAEATYPWLLAPGAKFVAKPDQLIKRRGKSGLLALNKSWADARAWIEERAGKPQRVETVDGVLRQFLVEPFVPHAQDTEYYININSVREVCAFFFLLFFTSCPIGRILPPRQRAWELGERGEQVQNGSSCASGSRLQRMLQVLFSGPPGEGNEGESLSRPTTHSTLLISLHVSVMFTCQLAVCRVAFTLPLFFSFRYAALAVASARARVYPPIMSASC
jgi:hypothetical protein